MTKYKREFKNYCGLPFDEKLQLVLNLLKKIKQGSDILEQIYTYLSTNSQVDETDLQEIFIAVLTGMKTADENNKVETEILFEKLDIRLKTMKEKEAMERREEIIELFI